MKKQPIDTADNGPLTVCLYPMVALYVITLGGKPINAYRRRSFSDCSFKTHPPAFTSRGNAVRLARKLKALFPAWDFEVRKVEL